MGERRRCGDSALLPYSRTVSKQQRALPSEGEPGASAGAQGGVVGEVERRLRERVGLKGAQGFLSGAVASVTGRSARGALGVHWLGGAVASPCRVEACAASKILEGCVRPEVPRRSYRPFGHIRARRCSTAA
jgi:hypothetical protein